MDPSKGKKYKSLSKRTVQCGKCFKILERIENLQAHFDTNHNGEGAYEKGQKKINFTNLKSRKRTHDGNPPEEELAHLSEDTNEATEIIQRPSSAPLFNPLPESSYFPDQSVPRPESAPPDNQSRFSSSPVPGPSLPYFGHVTPPPPEYGQQSLTNTN